MFVCCAVFSLQALSVAGAPPEKPAASQKLSLAEGQLVGEVAATWQAKTPRVSIIEKEFMIPAAQTVEQPTDSKTPASGRLTIMRAGGSVPANVDRWAAQFRDAKGGAVKPKLEKSTIPGGTLHRVELAGTFLQRRGPFAPATEKPGHRMLGAILETKSLGLYFFKFTGPEETVRKASGDFDRMLQSLKTGT